MLEPTSPKAVPPGAPLAQVPWLHLKSTRDPLQRGNEERTYSLKINGLEDVFLGGGFKYLLFSSLFGEDSHFD